MISENFVIIGVAISVFGSWSYLIDTLKGRVKPNKVSWLLWSIAPMIAFFAMIKQGVGLTALATFTVGFLPFIIFLASFFNKNATWDISKLDIICGALSIFGLILWAITKVGNIAIFFSIVADALAAVPTIVKSFKYPETENSTIFFFGIVNALIALLAIKEWNFQSYGFQLYIVIVNSTIATLIKFKWGLKLSK